jgi:hypothetical protein
MISPASTRPSAATRALSVGFLTFLLTATACATPQRTEHENGGLSCPGTEERVARVRNYGPGVAELATWGYGIQHAPVHLGTLGPGMLEEFVLTDSVLVRHAPTLQPRPIANTHERGGAEGVGAASLKIDYFCR